MVLTVLFPVSVVSSWIGRALDAHLEGSLDTFVLLKSRVHGVEVLVQQSVEHGRVATREELAMAILQKDHNSLSIINLRCLGEIHHHVAKNISFN